MGSSSLIVVSTITGLGSVTFFRANTPTSLARPKIPKQSPRLGVRSNSILISSKSSVKRTSSPSVTSAGSSSIPSDFSSRPNSSAEQSMPFDSIPRIVVPLISNGFSFSGKIISAPTFAKGAFIPDTTFGAPQTT